MYTIIIYPNCSTCKKLVNYLKNKGEEFVIRDITKEVPSVEELKKWHEESGLDIKKFFNTSGKIYKESGLSKKLPDMSMEERFNLLASDGMIIKRPIVLKDDKFICVGKFEEFV